MFLFEIMSKTGRGKKIINARIAFCLDNNPHLCASKSTEAIDLISSRQEK